MAAQRELTEVASWAVPMQCLLHNLITQESSIRCMGGGQGCGHGGGDVPIESWDPNDRLLSCDAFVCLVSMISSAPIKWLNKTLYIA